MNSINSGIEALGDRKRSQADVKRIAELERKIGQQALEIVDGVWISGLLGRTRENDDGHVFELIRVVVSQM